MSVGPSIKFCYLLTVKGLKKHSNLKFQEVNCKIQNKWDQNEIIQKSRELITSSKFEESKDITKLKGLRFMKRKEGEVKKERWIC